MRKIKLSLTNYTAIAFSSFLIITVSIIILVSYDRMSQMAHDATAKQFQANVASIHAAVSYKYKPITQLFGYLTTSADWNKQRASDIKLLKSIDLARYLSKDSLTNSVYMGFENGDFLGVHKLNSATAKNDYNATNNANYVIETLTKQDNSNVLKRVYLNNKFAIINTVVSNNDSLNIFQRPWYKTGLLSKQLTPVPVYKDIRSNINSLTLVKKHQFSDIVIATDLNINTIIDSLKVSELGHDAIRVLLGDKGQFVIYHNNNSRLASIDQEPNTVANRQARDKLKQVIHDNGNSKELFSFNFKGENWIAQIHNMGFLQNNHARLLIAVPKSSILAPSKQLLHENMLMLISIGLLFIPLSWLFTGVLTRPLRDLSQQIKQVTALNVSGDAITDLSRIKEIAELQQSTAKMRKTLDDFLRLLTMLSNEQDSHHLLKKTCSEASLMLAADSAFVYLKSEQDENVLEPFILHTSNPNLDADIKHCPILSTTWPYQKLRNNVNIKDIQFNLIHPMLKTALIKANIHPKDSNIYTLTIPLIDRNNNVLGLLGFSYNECIVGEELTHIMGVATALSDFVSLSFEGQNSARKQKDLLNSFIKLIAGAIDTKSPYTGAHCQRVPELTSMLADAACNSTQAPFKRFNLTPSDWEQLNIAAWLHDCGKVTTPEYVIDKATKLETIYNRINEIRMRFEVLIRDAQIQALTAISTGEDPQQTNQQLAANIKQLETDFEFIAQCNLGDNFIDDAARLRLELISHRTWLRYLDDELGLSAAEIAQKTTKKPEKLPTLEPVLIDKAEHMVAHIDNSLELEAHLRFNMKRPTQRNNLGELHNLKIQRGTINAEERYIINHHVIQTISMLEKLPLPEHLSRVPEIAGAHHEQLNGRGYPRGQKQDEISLEARILAIADVFEALTASDRPYKTAKSLSQSIKILSFMSKDKHIDADLFKLFLSSGIYLEYAQKYLTAEQIDDVDISQYL